jgi:hypothetical protein
MRLAKWRHHSIAGDRTAGWDVGEPINSPMFPGVFSERRATLPIDFRRPGFVGRGCFWFPKVPSDFIGEVVLWCLPYFGRFLCFRGKWAADPHLKTEDRPPICAKHKSSSNGDFNDIRNKTCGPLDRFDGALRFKHRAIPANA